MKRRFTIMTVDGYWHKSDWITDEEIQEALDEANGYLGVDPFTRKEVYVESADEAFEFMTQFLKYDTTLDNQVFSIDINGTKRHFNVRHIVSWQVEVFDESADPWSL